MSARSKDLDPQILARMVDDPLFFAESVLLEPFTGKPFRANYVQRQLFAALKSHRRIALRVSRQTGKTYGISVLSLWAALRKPNQIILLLAPDEKKVMAIVNNIDRFIEYNPFLKYSLVQSHGKPMVERVFSNGSRIAGVTLGSTSRKKGESVLGQSGDVIIVDEASCLNDEDWLAVNPIIEGSLYRPETIAVVASTPYVAGGRFYEIFTNPQMEKVWHRIHVPVTQNPDFQDRVDQIRAACPSELEWITQYLAEFPDSGAGVFRQSDVMRARADYEYSIYRAQGPVAIGVDWDKYRSGVNIAVIQYLPGQDVYELIYREEVEPTERVLTEGVQRVILLNDAIPNVQYIYVDRGYGDMQIEILKQEGLRRPGTGLQNKVVGFSFSQHVEMPDPVTGEPVKKRLKDAMLALFQHILENGRFRFPKSDEQLRKQLFAYHVVSYSTYGPRYSAEGDHVIDAICLALWALKDNESLFKRPPLPPPRLILFGNNEEKRVQTWRPLPPSAHTDRATRAMRSFALGAPSRNFSGGGGGRGF